MVGNSSLGEWLEGCAIGLDALRLRALRRATSLSTKRRLPLVAHQRNTPVEVQFTPAGCLNYPCRTPQ